MPPKRRSFRRHKRKQEQGTKRKLGTTRHKRKQEQGTKRHKRKHTTRHKRKHTKRHKRTQRGGLTPGETILTLTVVKSIFGNPKYQVKFIDVLEPNKTWNIEPSIINNTGDTVYIVQFGIEYWQTLLQNIKTSNLFPTLESNIDLNKSVNSQHQYFPVFNNRNIMLTESDNLIVKPTKNPYSDLEKKFFNTFYLQEDVTNEGKFISDGHEVFSDGHEVFDLASEAVPTGGQKQRGGTELTLGQIVAFCKPSITGKVLEVVPNGQGLNNNPLVVNNTGDTVYIIKIENEKEWQSVMRLGALIEYINSKYQSTDKLMSLKKQSGIQLYKNIFSSSWVELVFRNYPEISYASDWEKDVSFSKDILWNFMLDLEKKINSNYQYTFPYFPRLNTIKRCDESETDNDTKYDKAEVNKYLNAFYNFTPRKLVPNLEKNEKLYLYAYVPDAPKANPGGFFKKLFKPSEKYLVKFYNVIKKDESYKVGGNGIEEVINDTGKDVFIVQVVNQTDRPNKGADLKWINQETPGQDSIIFDSSLNLFPMKITMNNKKFLGLLTVKKNENINKISSRIDIDLLHTKKNIENGYFPVFGGHNLKLVREIPGFDDTFVEPKEIPDEYNEHEIKFFNNFYGL